MVKMRSSNRLTSLWMKACYTRNNHRSLIKRINSLILQALTNKNICKNWVSHFLVVIKMSHFRTKARVHTFSHLTLALQTTRPQAITASRLLTLNTRTKLQTMKIQVTKAYHLNKATKHWNFFSLKKVWAPMTSSKRTKAPPSQA